MSLEARDTTPAKISPISCSPARDQDDGQDDEPVDDEGRTAADNARVVAFVRGHLGSAGRSGSVRIAGSGAASGSAGSGATMRAHPAPLSRAWLPSAASTRDGIAADATRGPAHSCRPPCTGADPSDHLIRDRPALVADQVPNFYRRHPGRRTRHRARPQSWAAGPARALRPPCCLPASWWPLGEGRAVAAPTPPGGRARSERPPHRRGSQGGG